MLTFIARFPGIILTKPGRRRDEMRVVGSRKVAEHVYEVTTESAKLGRVVQNVLVLPGAAMGAPVSGCDRCRSPRPRPRCRRRGDRRFGAAQRFDDAACSCIVLRIFSTRFYRYDPQVVADHFVVTTKLCP
jgi:hypothetical protein